MDRTRFGGEFADVLRLLNEATSAEELGELLKLADTGEDQARLTEALLLRKRVGGGTVNNSDDLHAVMGREALMRLSRYAEKAAAGVKLEPERLNFVSLLLANPNYFGTVEGSPLPPVSDIKGNTSYEELTCVGLNTPLDRLEAVIHIKKNGGYSGGICTNGSIEWVRFYVDLHDNGIWHDAGLGWVRVHDIGGKKPLCYAVYRDFTPLRKICRVENIVRVRAILSWNTQPPANMPNWPPVWGNVRDVSVQIRPRFFIDFGDIVGPIPWDKIEIPDPIGPVIQEIDPKFPLPLPLPEPISVETRLKLYTQAKVPAHRFAFSEIKQAMAASPATLAVSKESPLAGLGLKQAEIAGILDQLSKTDGNTGYEELRCVGLKPERDMLEAVFTVKKKAGYSGSLCKTGSTEYVAFWGDFLDGNGWVYLGTETMQVHDLAQTPRDGVQYAVYLKKDLTKYLRPCETGARLVKVRAILSWEDPPPPANPNWVPAWGNREECLVQLRRGFGKFATILEVDDVAADDINGITGRATGTFVEASGAFTQAPFGGTIAISGTIGLGSDFFGGGAAPYKYRIEVKRDEPGSFYEPVTGKFKLRKVQRVNGFIVECAPGETICEFDQAPLPPAGEGGESGWYLYHEDLIGPFTQEILSDVLMKWPTNASMEGRWKMRLHARDGGGTHYFSDEVTVRIDNTAPVAVLNLTGATLNGNPLPALECGKFPVGTILTGTFSVSDPGAASALAEFQHHRTASLGVSPAIPGNVVLLTTSPASLDYNPPAVPTTGVAGTWTLDTSKMKACGYVLRLNVWDRTIVDAGNASGYHGADEFGFCLE